MSSNRDAADLWLGKITLKNELMRREVLRQQECPKRHSSMNTGSRIYFNISRNHEQPADFESQDDQEVDEEVTEANDGVEAKGSEAVASADAPAAPVAAATSTAAPAAAAHAVTDAEQQPADNDPNHSTAHLEKKKTSEGVGADVAASKEEEEGEEEEFEEESEAEAEEYEEDYEDEDEQAYEYDEEEEEDEDEEAGTEGKTDFLDDDFEAPVKKDSLEEELEKEMEALALAKMEETVEVVQEEEEEEEETEEDIIRDLKIELEEAEEDRNQVELMIDFYEHRLAHGCLIKNIASKGGNPKKESDVSKRVKVVVGTQATLASLFGNNAEEGDDILQTRFQQLLKLLDKTKKDFAESTTKLNAEINEEIQLNRSYAKQVEDEINGFNSHRRRVAESAVFVENNRIIDMKEIERHEQVENIRRQEILKLRLRNIFLRNALAEKEAEVKTGINYEEMEQMLMQNQLLQNRIEQKAINNERVKGNLMRRVACITHVRQKAEMMMEDVSVLTTESNSLDHSIQRLKEDLTHLRKIKDICRKRLEGQRRDNGLLGQDSLMRDMETQHDEAQMQERLLQALVDRTNALNEETSQMQETIKALEVQNSLRS